MVRKNCERSPAKSIRHLRCHQRRRHLHTRKRSGHGGNATNYDASPASWLTALLSAITGKASRCRNRLIRIFSKLADFVDTPKTGSRYRGYRVLRDRLGGSHDVVIGAEDSVSRVLCFDNTLPPCAY